MDATTLAAQIASAQAQLTQLAAAIAAEENVLITGYSFDSGQSAQTTSRAKLESMYGSQSMLENRLCTLQARQTGSGATLGVPLW